jgi:23S rRNA pseudouridine1911/1915/1917 synthase
LAEQIISTPPADDESDAVWEGATEAVESRPLQIPVTMHGWRIDRALAELVPEFSRSYLQQLLQEGAVLWRGAVAGKAAAKVSVGDALTVHLRPTQQTQAFKPEPMAFEVVFEDEHLMVLVKPAGLVVHPAAGNWSGTLLNGLLAWHEGARHLPRAGIVHRLDKDTSGLMMVAKSRQAMDALVQAIAAREVQREYVALAHGLWRSPLSLTVDQPIGRDHRNRLRMAVVSSEAGGAKPAQTTIARLDGNPQATLVKCKLHTGRTHQIRVHMAWLGHPLVADAVYGGRAQWGLQRQALHARALRLTHPVDGRALSFLAEPPPDFMNALAQSGLHYNTESDVPLN